MAYVRHPIASLIHVDPAAARKQLRAVFVRASACRLDAAAILGCKVDTFARWCAAVGVDLVAIEEESRHGGWHHGRAGGRPRGRIHRRVRSARAAA